MDNNTNTNPTPTPANDTPDTSGEGEVSGYGLGMATGLGLGSDQPLPINEDAGGVTGTGDTGLTGTVDPAPWSGVVDKKEEIYPPPAP